MLASPLAVCEEHCRENMNHQGTEMIKESLLVTHELFCQKIIGRVQGRLSLIWLENS